MKREDLTFAIRELGRRIHLNRFYIIGSSAIFAAVLNPQDSALTRTLDVDVIPAMDNPEDVQKCADRIDFLFGEGSPFEEEHKFHIQGVDFSTPTYAPKGWTDRAVPIKSGTVTAMCMEIHDLALSKYGAGRDKDLEFTAALARAGFVSKETLLERLSDVDQPEPMVALMASRINNDFHFSMANVNGPSL